MQTIVSTHSYVVDIGQLHSSRISFQASRGEVYHGRSYRQIGLGIAQLSLAISRVDVQSAVDA